MFSVCADIEKEVGTVFVESELCDLSKIIDQGIDVALKRVGEFVVGFNAVKMFVFDKINDVRHDMVMHDMCGLHEDHIHIFVDAVDLSAVGHREGKV